MIRYITLAPILLSLTACDLSDLTSPGTASKAAYEHRQSLLIPIRTNIAETSVIAAVEVSVEAECHEEFRIRRCGPDGELPWSYQ